MDHIFRLILIGGLFLLAACKTVDEEALDTAEVSQQTLTPEETIVSNMPDWCLISLFRSGALQVWHWRKQRPQHGT